MICYGGRGSSKSQLAAKKLIYRCLTEPYFRYILYRKTYNTIKDSQFQTIKDIVYEWGLQDLFIFNVSPLEIRCINGNKFICRGGDEPKKLKSIKDPTGVWYEEEIPDEGDFITITTSIRTQKAEYLQEIFTINPEVEGDYTEHWFWQRFFKDKPDGTFSDKATIDIGDNKTFETTYTVHHSTYKDNRWLPDSFKAQLLDLQRTNPYYYTIYVLGMWGNRTTDGNFYSGFDRTRNVLPQAECRYNPLQVLHVTFDFNVNPYVTICIWQITGKRATQIDEICLPTPNNRTDLACREFCRRYRGHQGGVFIYGDPAGLHEDTRTEKGYNDFRIIANELAEFRPQMKYQKVAPPVHTRGQFINAVFSERAQGLDFIISDKCTNSIADYMFLKMASDGTKAKIKTKNPDTGVSYEKYGHCFVGETMITTYKGDVRIDQIKEGDLVLTRSGYKPVLKIFDNGYKYVNTYRIGNKKITCTPDHKFWTKEHNFKEIGHLINSTTFCIFEETKICNKKLNVLNLTDIDLSETHSATDGQTGYIFQDGLRLTGNEKNRDTIDIYGLSQTGKYLKDIIYTTKTVIRSIMTLKIWNVLMGRSILVNTTVNCQNMLSNIKLIFLMKRQEKRQKNGINQTRVGNGIKNICGLSWKANAENKTVLSVEMNLKPYQQEKQNIVQENVEDELQPVYSETKKRVYDIMVEDEHEYFANGILVHNCSDSNDYMICSAFASEFIAWQRGSIIRPTTGKNYNKHIY